MTFIETYGKEIIALLVPLVTWVLNVLLREKAKLLLATRHTFTFLVQEPLRDAQGNVIRPTQTVHTRSLMLSNAGRATATKVELVFNWKPQFINIWPPRHYVEHTEPDKRYVLIFDSLAPNENVSCEIFQINGDLPDVLLARSDQCLAQDIVMQPVPIVQPWKRKTAMVLMFGGLALFVYLVIVVLQFLVIRTPLGR